MKKFTSKELRNLWLNYFINHGHAVIPSASLIPENDPTVLFTTAGMHPLVPYLLGEKHPKGKRLVDIQKCVRTGDIDEVGDNSHCTFFEMLGNWSLGDYFKEEMINFSFEFLTKYLDISINDIAVSIFEGNIECPKDEISAHIWEKLGIKKTNIFYLSKKHNWWGPIGGTGPCGPDTEMFIINHNSKCKNKNCSPACGCDRYLEVWNDVFMEYYKDKNGKYSELSQKNVDTGMGLERMLCILQDVSSIYETDLFVPIIKGIENLTNKNYDENNKIQIRIIADHMRTITFMLNDGVHYSNVDQGYILRRLTRRAIRMGRLLNFKESLNSIIDIVISIYGDLYFDKCKISKIKNEFIQEENRFLNVIDIGIKEFYKMTKNKKLIDGVTAFRLYDTFGFPIEMTMEIAKENNLEVDIKAFEKLFKEHKQKSAKGAEQKFKGGLSDTKIETARLHTATHLLLAGLKKVLNDPKIEQRGSNITSERLRFDFNFQRPLTNEEIKAIEKYVNSIIKEGVEVKCEEMSLEDAYKNGATGIFKYGDVVKVFTIGNYSKEICGGPHAKNTKELGEFKIQKEQSSSAGVRRIKAVLV